MPWHISERGGGAEVQAAFLAGDLVKKGFIVAYVCQTIQKDRIETTTQNDGYTIHWLKPSGRFPWIDQNKYKKKLATIHPYLIVQRMSSNVTYVLGKYAKKNRITFVWICTDNHCPSRNYFVENFKIKFSFKIKNSLKYLVSSWNAWLMDKIRNSGMQWVNIAFTQNDVQEQAVKANFKKDSFRMISGHPQPLEQLSVSDRFSKKTILWAANWGSHKRPELFMDIGRKLIDSHYRLVMLGGHSDKVYVDKLVASCPNNIELKGQLNFEEALTYFDQATIFINTSTPGGDGFPNTFIQGWLRGVPVISLGFDPGLIIQNYHLGFNVATVDDGVEKINYLLSNVNLYEEMSENCLAYSNKNHSINKMTDNFLTILQNEGITLH